ncbi:hypothetical protein DdX_19480 [Ditylenchus destructor]|uniref:Uncharacterized protein n=1 Tax=Ditylenchus destructor TaxID=166010 RepID=A0AAD4QU65_9BILA|nr:hypothetical protein DdX_19480 [Ditylenchus destructor]
MHNPTMEGCALSICPYVQDAPAVTATDHLRLAQAQAQGFAADHAPNPGFSGFPEARNLGNHRCSRLNRYQSTQLAETKRFMYHTPGSELRRVIIISLDHSASWETSLERKRYVARFQPSEREFQRETLGLVIIHTIFPVAINNIHHLDIPRDYTRQRHKSVE